MGFLDFVEQDDRVGLTPYGLGQLSAFVIPHVSRRGSDKPADAVLLLILAHVDTCHHAVVVEEVVGQGLRQLRLSHTGGAEEDERPDRSLRVLQSGTATSYGVAHGEDGLVLTYHALMQLFLQVEQLLALALLHLRHRDAGPAAHNLGDVVARHLFLHHRVAALSAGQLLVDGLVLSLQRLDFSVADLCHLTIVAFALGTVGLEFQPLYLLLVMLDLVEQRPLCLPFRLVLLLFFLEVGDLLLHVLQTLACALVLVGGCACRAVNVALDGLTLDFKLFQLTADVVKLLWHRVTLHPQLGGGLVHQVDGLVRQEPVGDVTVRQLHGADDGLVLDTHLVMVLVPFLQASQDADGVYHVRLIHHHGLEPPLQRLVLLKVFLVLIEGGGADAAQLSSGQRRLQDVGGVHGALALAGSHQRVDFVDEKDDVAFALHHFVHHALQPLLKLALVFCAGNQRAHVE